MDALDVATFEAAQAGACSGSPAAIESFNPRTAHEIRRRRRRPSFLSIVIRLLDQKDVIVIRAYPRPLHDVPDADL